MKKVWLKPIIVTYREDVLISKMSIKAQTPPHEDAHGDSTTHVDTHTDVGSIGDL